MDDARKRGQCDAAVSSGHRNESLLERNGNRRPSSLYETQRGSTRPGRQSELHDFKNLKVVSNIPGAAITGSKRATDLHMKVEYLRGRHGERVMTGATATPIHPQVLIIARSLRVDALFAVHRPTGRSALMGWHRRRCDVHPPQL